VIKRAVRIETPFNEQESALIVLCDAYGVEMNSFFDGPIGAGGVVATELPVTKEDRCYKFKADNKSFLFWVYEGDAEQVINLLDGQIPKKSVNNFFLADDESLRLNSDKVFCKVIEDESLINEEEKRFLCRYSKLSDGADDKAFCVGVDSRLSV